MGVLMSHFGDRYSIFVGREFPYRIVSLLTHIWDERPSLTVGQLR